MKLTIAILIVLLLTSNAFWFYCVIDAGVTMSYREQQQNGIEETIKQLQATFPEIAKNATKGEIVAATSKYTEEEVFEKDGCTWVGWLGLKFDKNNKLESVSLSWSQGENDPCYRND